MALRLVELTFPDNAKSIFQDLLQDRPVLGWWLESSAEKHWLVRVLVPAEESEALMDGIQQRCSGLCDFHVILLPVEAALPRTQSSDESLHLAQNKDQAPKPKTARVSREELYTEVIEGCRISRVFLAMVVLSSVVATVGLVRNDLAVIIAAMVIAPLLSPNVALSLATTLGDLDLALRALRASVAGMLTAFLFAVMVGCLMQVDSTVPAIASRTHVGLADLALALAAGAAGTFAITTGTSGALIGVMVAVALMPPLVVSGMLLGTGNWSSAIGALELLIANLICVNLAGVVTFLAQGVVPARYWEAERASQATRIAIAIWVFLLAILLLILFLS